MSDPITPEYLDELDALSEAATEGPWEPRARMNSCRADDAFIAAARQAVPRLVKALREAREEAKSAYQRGHDAGFYEGICK